MKVWTQVIGLDAPDTSPSVLIATDANRYIVNVGEGLQRFCVEHRTKLVRVDGIFLSHVAQSTVGGLSGLLLTLADAGRKHMRLYSAPGLVDYMFACRHFMRRSDVSLEACEVDDVTAGGPPPILLPELTVYPVVSVSTACSSSSLSSVESGLHALWRTDVSFAPFQGLDADTVLSGYKGGPDKALAAAAADAETPSSRLWLAGNGPGSQPSAARVALEVARKEQLMGAEQAGRAPHASAVHGVPIPVPFNPLFACQHGASSTQADTPLLPSVLHTYARYLGKGGAGAGAGGLQGQAPASKALSYIFATKPVTGRFLVEQAKALGIPAGPLYGKLTKGESVTINGRTVLPEQVKEPDQPGQNFAVISCPTVDHIFSLCSSPRWVPYMTGGGGLELAVMYHMAPADVVGDPQYCAWMARFSRVTRHIMLHPEGRAAVCATLTSLSPPVPVLVDEPPGQQAPPVMGMDGRSKYPVMYSAQAQQQCRMHILEPSLFPVPLGVEGRVRGMGVEETGGQPPPLTPMQQLAAHMMTGLGEDKLQELAASAASRSSRSGEPKSILATSRPEGTVGCAPDGTSLLLTGAQPLTAFHLLPKGQAGLDAGTALRPCVPAEVLAPALVDAHVQPVLRQALGKGGCGTQAGQAGIEANSKVESPAPHPDAMLMFTGTASAVPTKNRNVSGMYLLVPPPVGAPRVPAPAIDGWTGAILDCGEGTYGQMCRIFGPSGAPPSPVPHVPTVDHALACTRLLWISHMHADHHLGALRLIGERKAARARLGLPPLPVLVVGPTKMVVWLLEASRVDPTLCGPGSWLFVDAERYAHVMRHGVDIQLVLPEQAPAPTCPQSAVDAGEGEGAEIVGLDALEPILPGGQAGGQGEGEGEAPSSKRSKAEDGTAKAAASEAVSTAAAQIWQPNGAGLAALPIVGPSTLLPQVVIPWAADTGQGLEHVLGPSTGYLATPAFVQATFASMGLSALRTVHVQHCFKAYGLRLEFLSTPPLPTSTPAWPWSVLYSGDTRPCKQLVALGMGSRAVMYRGPRRSAAGADRCVHFDSAGVPTLQQAVVPERQEDAGLASWVQQETRLLSCAQSVGCSSCGLLVHEATFDDTCEGRGNALDKRHSTVDEALAVAQGAGAHHTILTHFSARYPKLPTLKAPASSSSSSLSLAPCCEGDEQSAAAPSAPRVSVAYDLCTVHGRDLPRLHAMLPALHALFAEDEGEEEEAEGEHGHTAQAQKKATQKGDDR